MNQGEIQRSIYGDASGTTPDVFPMFKREAVQNDIKTLEQGRPIFDVIEIIQIIIPGDNKTSPVRLVKEDDKARFAEAYRRFKDEEEMVFEGTPVDAWPRLTTAQVYQLKAMGFFTVESIAGCSDSNIGKLGMGGLMLRDMARGYIEAAKNGGNAERLVAENAQLRTQMAAMAQTIQDLTGKFEAYIKQSGGDVAKVNVDAALSHTREAVGVKMPALPAGWQDYSVKKLIELCAEKDFPVTPRNKDEALGLLNEYEAKRAAARIN